MVKQRKPKLSEAQKELITKLHQNTIIVHQHYMGRFQGEKFYLARKDKLGVDYLQEKAINPYTFDKLLKLGFLSRIRNTKASSYYKLNKDWEKALAKCSNKEDWHPLHPSNVFKLSR